MDFTPTEAQRDLGRLTRTITEKLTTNDRLRELDTAQDRIDDALWRALADAGVLAAALPESVGGGGFGILEQCSVLCELGRTLAPVPYLTSVVLGAAALAEFGGAADLALAARAAEGSAVVTVALVEELNYDPALPVTRAERAEDGWAITGTKITVPAATVADAILVPATTPDGVAVFVVDPAADGVRIDRQITTDHAAEAIVDLSGVVPIRMLGDLENGPRIVAWILDRAAVGVAALQYGTLERALELVAEYARERVQFDRPIGSFQAVAQRLADAFIDVNGVRSTLWQAAWRLSVNLPAAAEIRTAKFWAADAGHRVAHTVIHVHGGVGLDRDHPVHRYFLAAKHNEFALGSATEQLRRLGRLLADDPA